MRWKNKEPVSTTAQYKAAVLMAKCRLAPIQGTTVPRTELSGLVVGHRLTLLAAAGATFRITRATILTDSECTIAITRKTGGLLKPYSANRAGEIHDLSSDIKKLVGTLDPIRAIPGSQNPADQGTRGKTSIQELREGFWQRGPPWLVQDRGTWPLTTHVSEEVPLQELRTGRVLKTAAAVTTVDRHQKDWEQYRQTEEPGLPPPPKPSKTAPAPPVRPNQTPTLGILTWGVGWRTLYNAVCCCMKYSNSWEKTQRITARATRLLFLGAACTNSRAPLRAEELAAARALQFLTSAPSALAALQANSLQSLGAAEHQGEVFVRGRVQPGELREVLGITRLRIIMPSTRLAFLILQSCHNEDHRGDVRDCLARARRVCWIPRGRALARSIVASCLTCRRESKKTETQAMGMLPSLKAPSLAPFVACGIDLMGPYMVREQRSRHIKYKVWASCYTCLSTKACSFVLLSGYSLPVSCGPRKQPPGSSISPRLEQCG